MRLSTKQIRERNQQLDYAIATGAARMIRLDVDGPPNQIEAEIQAMQADALKSPPSAWSDEPPRSSKSTFYWWREKPEDEPALVLSAGRNNTLCLYAGGTRLLDGRLYEHLGGQWQGPLEPLP